MLDVLMHAGTLIAVIWVFRANVGEIVRRPWGPLARKVWVASIPTALIGLLFKDQFDRIFAEGKTLGIEFLLTGTILWWTETLPAGQKRLTETTYLDSFLIGVLQGAAILPAISRSGLTISGSIWRGLDRSFAAEFSFLVSIPAVSGAFLLETRHALASGDLQTSFSQTNLLAAAVAAVSGYFAIRYMLRLLSRSSLRGFAWYTWAIGALILADQLFFHRVFSVI
ncbi:MAG: undecaprenyl-diphosphatase [Bacilli bacterium]|nr:undecaprenyl-diphosphatase [Bacilli bacterium]